MTDGELDLVKQQVEELSAEAEQRFRALVRREISFEEFQMQHYCAVAKYKSLLRYVIEEHDAEQHPGAMPEENPEGS